MVSKISFTELKTSVLNHRFIVAGIPCRVKTHASHVSHTEAFEKAPYPWTQSHPSTKLYSDCRQCDEHMHKVVWLGSSMTHATVNWWRYVICPKYRSQKELVPRLETISVFLTVLLERFIHSFIVIKFRAGSRSPSSFIHPQRRGCNTGGSWRAWLRHQRWLYAT